MSGVRVLVGTRKGAFILTADGKRKKWEISGPHFAGWEIFHLKGSAAEPDRIYASQSTDWFAQVLQRLDDGGKTWAAMGNEFTYAGEVGTHHWYDGTPHPWEFKRVWHLEPSLEARYPVLRGNVRDHTTLERRPYLRFFACEEDFSHNSPDAPLPIEVVSGEKPFIIVGAIAGG